MIQIAQPISVTLLLLITILLSTCLFFLTLVISRIRDRINAKRELLTPFKITEHIQPLEIPKEPPKTIEKEETSETDKEAPSECPWLTEHENEVICELTGTHISESFTKIFCKKEEKWITCEYLPKNCPTCNTEIPPGSKFCIKCGTQIVKPQQNVL